VITIIAILTAVAITQYFNFENDAFTASANEIAGALPLASATNYAARLVNTLVPNTYQVGSCSSLASLMNGGIPTSYTFSGGVLRVDGTVKTFTLRGPNNSSITFTAFSSP
jgi:hypothetical protein